MSPPLTSTELVVGAVAVEVVALAELAAIDLGGVLALLADAGAADALTVVAADVVRAVGFPAVCVHVVRSDVVSAALAGLPDASVVAPVNRKCFC